MTRSLSIVSAASAVRIDATTMRVLLAAAESVTGVRPLRGHYESYYDRRASQSPICAQVYREFAAVVEGAALRLTRQEFASIALASRRHVLDAVRTSGPGRRFEDVFFQETLMIFLKTDAWLQVGYPSWEGSPRGLDSYRRQP